MKTKQPLSPVESAARLIQRVHRKKQLPPKYRFLNYVQAIRELKNASIPALADGEFDDQVANCLHYAQYHDDRTAILKLAHVLLSGDRSFPREFSHNLQFEFECQEELRELLGFTHSPFPQIIKTFKETFNAWKKYNTDKSARLSYFLSETHYIGLAKSYNVNEADRNFKLSWLDLRRELFKLGQTLQRKYSTKDMFSISDIITLPMYIKDFNMLSAVLEKVIEESIPTTTFSHAAEYEQLKQKSLAGLEKINQFVQENIHKENPTQTLDLPTHLASCFELCGFLFEHRESFNNGFQRHTAQEHWNHELIIKKAPPDQLMSFSHGGGLFYLTSFFGGRHPGYRADVEAHRRGIYATPDPEILGLTPPYMDRYYAFREAPHQFDIPVSFQGKIHVKHLDDSGRKLYEVILTKECVPHVSDRKVTIYKK